MMSEQQDTKYKVGHLVYGFMSGLGTIVMVKLREELDATPMYLVKHTETGEETWHLEQGIDKMTKMYDDWIAGMPVGIRFENLAKKIR
jgi:hypothetical protein